MAGLLCAQSVMAVVVRPVVDAVAEEQPSPAASAVGSSQPGGRATVPADEPGGLETALCRAIVEQGVPPTPRWSAGWTR